MYDVIIIGGGPSGLATAISILKEDRDKDILIFEEDKEIGKNWQCAAGLSREMAMEIENLLGFEIKDSTVERKFKKVIIHSPNEKFEIDTDKTIAYTIDRGKFEKNLGKMAKELGAKIKTDTKIMDLHRSGDKVVVKPHPSDSDKTYEAKKVVCADGPVSMMGEEAGLGTIVTPKNMHKGVQLTLEKEVDNPPIEIFFNSDYAKKGYTWVFPIENGYRVGLGVPISEEKDLMKKLDKFLEDHPKYKGEVVEERGGLIPTTKPCEPYRDKVALVGDALRVTDPVTGGGIRNGIVSAKLLGEVIGKGLPLSEYKRRLEEELIPYVKKRYKLKKNLLYKWDNDDFDRLIRAVQGFEIETWNPKKEIARLFKHIAVNDPGFIPKIVGDYLF